MTQKSLLTFLATQGQTDGAVNEREYNFLIGQGVDKKHLNEMWFQYLRNQGYTGSLSDMFLKWLENPSPITATVSPTIQSVENGDTWADLLLASATDTSNYSSTAGSISSAVAEIRIDGGVWTALSGNETTPLLTGELAEARVTVTDSSANERVFEAGSTTVAGSLITFDNNIITFDSTNYTFDEAA